MYKELGFTKIAISMDKILEAIMNRSNLTQGTPSFNKSLKQMERIKQRFARASKNTPVSGKPVYRTATELDNAPLEDLVDKMDWREYASRIKLPGMYD